MVSRSILIVAATLSAASVHAAEKDAAQREPAQSNTAKQLPESYRCSTSLTQSTHAGFSAEFDKAKGSVSLRQKNVAGPTHLGDLRCRYLKQDKFATHSMAPEFRCDPGFDTHSSMDSGYIVELSSPDIQGIRYAFVWRNNVAGSEKVASLPCQAP